MSLATAKAGRRKAKLGYRKLVQDSAHGIEVDPDSVEKTLILANRSWENFESDTIALEESLEELATYQNKDYESAIVRHDEIRRQAAEMRKQLEAEQKVFNERWQQLRDLEQRGFHVSTLRNARDTAERELMRSRANKLGTTNLDEFPAID